MRTEIIDSGAVDIIPGLPTGAWDLVTFLNSAKNYGEVIGGGLISLLGLIVLIVAAVFIAKKFFGNGQREEKSWLMIIVMVIVGGALLTGGIGLIMTIGSGGQKTIEDLGGGFIVLQGSLGLIR